jgi:hypothetical protein
MSNSPNPYASPVHVGPMVDSHQMPPDAVAKAETIIKDAGQFWLAIIMCFCCSGIGSLIIGPWYFFRLTQWNALSSTYSYLREPGPANSLAARFQGAKTKLIIGISFGVVMLGVWAVIIFLNVAAASM